MGQSEKDSESVLGVWLPAPLPTSRAPPDRGTLWPLAWRTYLGGLDVGPCGIVCYSLRGLTHPPSIPEARWWRCPGWWRPASQSLRPGRCPARSRGRACAQFWRRTPRTRPITRETGHTHNNTTRTTPQTNNHTNEPPHHTLNNAQRCRDDSAYHHPRPGGWPRRKTTHREGYCQGPLQQTRYVRRTTTTDLHSKT